MLSTREAALLPLKTEFGVAGAADGEQPADFVLVALCPNFQELLN